MCITGDHGTPFISPCLYLHSQENSYFSHSSNNLFPNKYKRQKPIHNCALISSICSSAKFTAAGRSGILIILFLLFGKMLSTTARSTYSSDKTLSVTKRTNNRYSFLSSAYSTTFMPTRFEQHTNKLHDKTNLHTAESQMYRNKAKRYSKGDDRGETKLLSSELIEFICQRLPDPCARAAYLRQHVKHDLCLHLPLLYLLPHTDFHSEKYLSEYKFGTCKGGLSRLTYLPSDSIFEQFLTPVHTCENSLISLKMIMDEKLRSHFEIFDDLLEKSFCIKSFDSRPNVTGECQCQECQEAYRNWYCATEFPLYYPLDDSDITMHLQRKSINNDITDDVNLDQPHTSVSADRSINSKLSGVHVTDPILLNKSLLSSSPVPSIESTSEHAGTYRYPTLTEFQLTSHVLFRLEIIQPCISWCTQVETVCPYLNPADSTSNGGEPAFLCDESHYHHSSRYQAVYWDVDTCESECCFGITDSKLLSLSTFDSKQSSLHSDVLLSYSSASSLSSSSFNYNDNNEDVNNQSCTQLRDRCLHRLLSIPVSEFPMNLNDETTILTNTDNNNNNNDNNLSRNDSINASLSTLHYSSSSNGGPRGGGVMLKIDNISFTVIFLISFTFYCFIWLQSIHNSLNNFTLLPVWLNLCRLGTIISNTLTKTINTTNTTATAKMTIINTVTNRHVILMPNCIISNSPTQHPLSISTVLLTPHSLREDEEKGHSSLSQFNPVPNVIHLKSDRTS